MSHLYLPRSLALDWMRTTRSTPFCNPPGTGKWIGSELTMDTLPPSQINTVLRTWIDY
jgi:hypothetical protein